MVEIEQLKSNAEFFDNMVNLIHPRFYIPKSDDDDEPAMDTRFFKHTKTPGNSKRFLMKQQKRDQLDPTKAKDTITLQKELKEKEDAEEMMSDGDSDDASETGLDEEPAAVKSKAKASDSDDDLPPWAKSDSAQKKKKSKKVVVTAQAAASVEELRRRLHEHISDLRGKRKIEDVQSSEQQQDAKRQKREDSKKKKKKKGNKTPAPSTTTTSGTNADDKSAKVAGSAAGKQQQATPAGAKQQKAGASQPPQQQKQAQKGASTTSEKSKESPVSQSPSIQFGNFEFSTESAPVHDAVPKPKMSKQALLQRAEALQKRLKELEGTEEGKELAQKVAFDTALQRAQGQKVRDDPKLLKKAIKKDQAKKKKSAREWAEREKAVKDKMEMKQIKRKEHMQARREALKSKGNKKKKARPGFEGRRSSKK